MTKLSERARRELQNVHPALVATVERAWEILGKAAAGYEIWDGSRTYAEQVANVRRGASKTMKSRHLIQPDGLAYAVDIVVFKNGSPSWPNAAAPWKPIAAAMHQAAKELNVPVENGFEQWGWDRPHWQIPLGFRWSKGNAPAKPPARKINDRLRAILAIMYGHEGGYVNDPVDPGGPTNMGIIQTTLSTWRGHPVTAADVQKLTREEATEIYDALFWDVMRCDEIPVGMDYCIFDAAVGSGTSGATRQMQRWLNVEADGIFGDQTMAALNAFIKKNGIEDTIDAYQDMRSAYIKTIPHYWKYKNGWERRITEVRGHAKRMAGTVRQPDDPGVDKPKDYKPEQDPKIVGPGTVGVGVAAWQFWDQPLFWVALAMLIAAGLFYLWKRK